MSTWYHGNCKSKTDCAINQASGSQRLLLLAILKHDKLSLVLFLYCTNRVFLLLLNWARECAVCALLSKSCINNYCCALIRMSVCVCAQLSRNGKECTPVFFSATRQVPQPSPSLNRHHEIVLRSRFTHFIEINKNSNKLMQ